MESTFDTGRQRVRSVESFPVKHSQLYRLAKRDYANLSGVGAAKAGGGWNRVGQEAIYTSTELSTPWLERLVHTPKGIIPRNLALMEIHLDLSGISVALNGPFLVHGSLKAAKF